MTWLDMVRKYFPDNQSLMARIDELMFEYCPDEMTPEQIANYEAHQKAVKVNRELH